VAAGAKTAKTKQRRFLTRFGRLLRRAFITEKCTIGCTLRIYTKKQLKVWTLGRDAPLHFGAFALEGFRIAEIEVTIVTRKRVSKYGTSKQFAALSTCLYWLFKISQRPLHLFGYISLCVCSRHPSPVDAYTFLRLDTLCARHLGCCFFAFF